VRQRVEYVAEYYAVMFIHVICHMAQSVRGRLPLTSAEALFHGAPVSPRQSRLTLTA